MAYNSLTIYFWKYIQTRKCCQLIVTVKVSNKQNEMTAMERMRKREMEEEGEGRIKMIRDRLEIAL